VLTRAEVRALLAHVRPPYRLMAELLYGSGLRLLECLHLRVKDIDFGYSRIVVRSGKGGRIGWTMLPGRLTSSIEGASGACESGARARFAIGFRFGPSIGPVATQISQCTSGMDVAVRFPCREAIDRSSLRPCPAASCFGEAIARRSKTSCAAGGTHKAGKLPHVAALLCHTLTRRRLRHSNRPGVVRPFTP
jgi:hypothetical protein